MKKKLLICFMGAVLLHAEIISKEMAIKHGEGQATRINFMINSSYEEKIQECDNLEKLPFLVGVENKKEIMPIVINSCKEALSK